MKGKLNRIKKTGRKQEIKEENLTVNCGAIDQFKVAIAHTLVLKNLQNRIIGLPETLILYCVD